MDVITGLGFCARPGRASALSHEMQPPLLASGTGQEQLSGHFLWITQGDLWINRYYWGKHYICLFTWRDQ